jgi:putative ABC transport system permease protein
MLQNYVKIAFRSLWNSKTHSSINILGLGVGIACCVLIALFVKDEWTYDRFHSKAGRIYRVFVKEDWGENQQFFNTVTPFPMGPVLKENFQEVQKQSRFVQTNTQVRVGEQQFSETLSIAGEDFFTMFDFETLKGSAENVLTKQSSIVISDWVAQKYFGEVDPINKTISVQLGESFEEFNVAAVVHIPTNSSLRFYLLISDLSFPKLYNPQVLTSGWFNVNPETYVLLQDGINPESLAAKFPTLFKTLLGDEQFNQSHYKVGLQPLQEIHLDTAFPVGIAAVSNPKYAFILAGIAILILAVACINFVTLAVGRSIKRAKEVGIRKVVGAQRKEIIFQFIGEALLVTFMALFIGLVVSFLSLPIFNDLSGKQLVFPFNLFLVIVILILLVLIGLISGSYPAFVLSAFKPISILKGTSVSGNSKQRFRKVLVGVQLTLSVFLISSTLFMREQMWMLQNKNLGFDKEQLAMIQLNVPRGGRLAERVRVGFGIAEQFKSEMAKFPDVTSVCATSHDFGNGNWTNVGYTDDKGTYRTFDLNTIDDDYLPTMKMELVQGRNFSDSIPSDKRRSVIVNEAFAREYGWTNAVGQRIPGKNFQDHEVIAVVKDFNYTSLYTKVQPLVMVQDPAIILTGIENININNSPIPKLAFRLKAGNMKAALEQVESVWDKVTGGQEFSVSFADQALAAQYRSDENLGRIIGIATWLAIGIGCMGLYALASLALQSRIKEVSIRKVMGADHQSLLILLSKDFVLLVLISVMISIPVTVLFIREWLNTFEYKISIGWEVFLLAGGISLMIALLTIGYHTVKTALAQPAESLKYE